MKALLETLTKDELIELIARLSLTLSRRLVHSVKWESMSKRALDMMEKASAESLENQADHTKWRASMDKFDRAQRLYDKADRYYDDHLKQRRNP